MTPEFKQAMEAAADKMCPQNTGWPSINFIRSLEARAFKIGSAWTVEKICEWLRSDEAIESMAEYKNKFKTMPGILFWADEIERKFGRGGGCKQKTFR